jgi:hypothetical protein
MSMSELEPRPSINSLTQIFVEGRHKEKGKEEEEEEEEEEELH